MMKLEKLLCEICKKPFAIKEGDLFNISLPDWEHLTYKLEDKEFHLHNSCYQKRLFELILGREI